MDHATVRYKLAARAKLDELHWTYEELWRQMRARFPATAPKSSEAINLFLGKQDRPPIASNCRFMTEMNKVLGFAPPPRCDPASEISQLQDRIADVWWQLTPTERDIVLRIFTRDDGESSGVPGQSGSH